MAGGWSEKISKLDEAAKLEIGILAPEPSRQSEELSLGGFLTDVGEDTKASMLTKVHLPDARIPC